MSLTYNRYLKIDELLRLQQPLSDGPEHDELLFITIHQVYELWFKQVLHELNRLQASFEANQHPALMETFKRILTILKILVAQVDILETMTPVSFQSFRARLDAASGFQSLQFREVEFALGSRRANLLQHYEAGGDDTTRLVDRLASRSVYDSFLRFLGHREYAVPAELLERDVSGPVVEDSRVRALLVQIYHHDPMTRDVCERLVDLDEGLQEWRYRHVKMVERTIGTKSGTGGSAGAEYLKRTLFQPLFPDLWAIRSDL
ncbi:MAG: tryptophan 2,3-dioxygenase family protein [Acidobacteriota bacterium]